MLISGKCYLNIWSHKWYLTINVDENGDYYDFHSDIMMIYGDIPSGKLT